MVIYPNFWADTGINVVGTINQGAVVITKTKPLFFTLGSRVVTSSLTSGDAISLAEGDRIIAGHDSMLIMTLPNESNLKLYPNSELVISKLEPINIPIIRMILRGPNLSRAHPPTGADRQLSKR